MILARSYLNHGREESLRLIAPRFWLEREVDANEKPVAFTKPETLHPTVYSVCNCPSGGYYLYYANTEVDPCLMTRIDSTLDRLWSNCLMVKEFPLVHSAAQRRSQTPSHFPAPPCRAFDGWPSPRSPPRRQHARAPTPCGRWNQNPARKP
jgi:hypothetical protein